MILTPDDLARCQAIAIGDIGKMRAVIDEVAEATGISANVLVGRRKTKMINLARQMAYYVGHRSGISFSDIARAMHRDHTTVMHGVRCEQLRRANPVVTGVISVVIPEDIQP